MDCCGGREFLFCKEPVIILFHSDFAARLFSRGAHPRVMTYQEPRAMTYQEPKAEEYDSKSLLPSPAESSTLNSASGHCNPCRWCDGGCSQGHL